LFVPNPIKDAMYNVVMPLGSSDQVLIPVDDHDLDSEVRIWVKEPIFVELMDLLQVLQGDGIPFGAAPRLDAVPSDLR
jgi:hypothetical protein